MLATRSSSIIIHDFSSWLFFSLWFIVWLACFSYCLILAQAIHPSRPNNNCNICHHRPSFLHKTSLLPSLSISQTSFNILYNIRGGDIQNIKSLSQVQEIIHNASSKNNQLVVLDFTANNCPPCEMIAPIYSDLSNLEEFQSKEVIFLKVNVNDHPDVASFYGVDGWPTFMLFKENKVVDSIVGGQAAKAGLYSLVARYA